MCVCMISNKGYYNTVIPDGYADIACVCMCVCKCACVWSPTQVTASK